MLNCYQMSLEQAAVSVGVANKHSSVDTVLSMLKVWGDLMRSIAPITG
jgi:hypothetical protein